MASLTVNLTPKEFADKLALATGTKPMSHKGVSQMIYRHVISATRTNHTSHRANWVIPATEVDRLVAMGWFPRKQIPRYCTNDLPPCTNGGVEVKPADRGSEAKLADLQQLATTAEQFAVLLRQAVDAKQKQFDAMETLISLARGVE